MLMDPGSKVNIYCKDGESALDVYNTNLFKFGGDLHFVNCDISKKWQILVIAKENMRFMKDHANRAKNSSLEQSDFQNGYQHTAGALKKFEDSNQYKTWMNSGVERKLKFEAMASYFCGRTIKYDETYHRSVHGFSNSRMVKHYCPDAVTSVKNLSFGEKDTSAYMNPTETLLVLV